MPDRKHEFEIPIAASPDEVWKAISEGPEITKWFAPDARVTPGEGGAVWLSWGPGMEGEAKISIWEPGRRLQTTEGPAENPKTVDYFIETRDGGTVLRLVHSGFGADAKFDDEYESTDGGWRTFLAMLQFGLERHPGVRHANATVFRFLDMPVTAVWRRLAAAMGLVPDELREGKDYHAQIDGEDLAGKVVRYPKPGYLCLSVENWNDALLSLFAEKCGGHCGLTIMCVVFGDAAPQAGAMQERWRDLVGRLFPAMEEVKAG